MKKISLLIALIAIAGGLWFKPKSTQQSSIPGMPVITAALDSVKETLAPIVPGLEKASPKGVRPDYGNADPVFLKANELNRKAVRSPEEEKELKATLSNKENIAHAVSTLKTFGAQFVQENQKERMAASLFMLNALAYEGNPSIDKIRAEIANLMLDPALELITDIKLKRSVAADRIELYMSLKEIFPKDADKVGNKASTELQKKLIAFANSFSNLKKKGT